MASGLRIASGLSPRRIVGFACNQAFLFFALYMGVNVGLDAAGLVVERADLAGVLLSLVLGFAVMKDVSTKTLDALLSRPAVLAFGVLCAGASAAAQANVVPSEYLAAWGLAQGFSCAVLLGAWSKAFGRAGTEVSVPEVFVASLVAAVACLAAAILQQAVPLWPLCLLPVASAVLAGADLVQAADAPAASPAGAGEGEGSEDAGILSVKVLAGTLSFGLAAGLMETFATVPGDPAVPGFLLCMLLFASFLIGALSLLLSDAFGRGEALNKAYRLAVFLMVAGALAAPFAEASAWSLSGQAVFIAGYLSLEAVLISLFLVLARLAGANIVHALSRGFITLFLGELLGVALANAVDADAAASLAVAAAAGVLALIAYQFLFTEGDFRRFTSIVAASDSFEGACRFICERFKLSPRESEILPYALRGRTAERIAGELSVSKSTVDTHLRRIYAKCGVHSRQELIDLGEAAAQGAGR